jgi:hypothetical protein
MSFAPDMRNLGGRRTIAEHLGKHLAKMLRIQPVVDCRTSPRVHIDGSTPRNSTFVRRLHSQARKTFERVASLERTGDL